MPRCDRHNEIEINLLERGKLTYLMGGRRISVDAGRLTVFWAGIPHQVIGFERLSDYFVLTVPLAWFIQWRLPAHFTQPILHGVPITDPQDGWLEADLSRMELWSRDLRAKSPERRHASLLEIQARLCRLAFNVSGEPAATRYKPSAALPPEHLSRAEQMACFIAQHYSEPLSAREISEQVGLHPSYAMTLFQRTFSTTLLKYVTEHRLSHAQRLLVTTDDSILDIAFSSGFGSLSRFNEAFRQAFACTPRDYRKAHRLV